MAESAMAAALAIFLRRVKRFDRLEPMPGRSGYRFLIVPPVWVLVAYRMSGDAAWTAMRVFGAILMLSGLVLWSAAHIQLGESFSLTPQALRLVTGGLYSRFRSPIYLFGGIALTGFVMVIDRPIWLLMFVVLIPMQIIRTTMEARVLEEKFGEEYREYARHTWF